MEEVLRHWCALCQNKARALDLAGYEDEDNWGALWKTDALVILVCDAPQT